MIQQSSLMEKLLSTYQAYLPFFIVCAVALAVIALILVFMAGRRLMARSARRTALAPPPGVPPVEKTRRARFWDSLKNGFKKVMPRRKKKDVFQRDQGSMDDGFKASNATLRSFFEGRDTSVDLPRYILVGAEGSGKTSLLDGLDLEMPLGRPVSSEFHHGNVGWWYFDQGVVLDVKGDFFLEKDHAHSEETAWDSLLKNLNKSRPKRPLDGIILTIPAHELVGPHRLSYDKTRDRAQVMYSKLWKLQKQLGMKIPVYVVVTQSDLVPGFKSFAAEIPKNNTKEMFGWSCPYTVDTGFSDGWVHEIFHAVHAYLAKVRLGIFAHGKVDHERDGVMLFPSEFLVVKENLGTYLCHLFKESSFHDSFFLRGVYFTGSAPVKEVSPFEASDILKSLTSSGDGNTKPDPAVERQVFTHDLFQKKIFREGHLATPIAKVSQQRQRQQRIMTLAGSSAAALWGLGILYNYDAVKDESKNLKPILKIVHHSIKGVNDRGGVQKEQDPSLLGYLNQEAGRILKAFVSVDDISSFRLFMPTSWVSPIDDYIRKSFTAAYDRIILPSLYAGLIQRGQDIIKMGRYDRQRFDDHEAFMNPLYSRAFGELSDFVSGLLTYEEFVKRYNHLDQSKSIEDLASLIGYLFHHNLPQHFYNDSTYYREALSKTLDRNVDLSYFRVPASQKLGKLFKTFLFQSLSLEKGYPVFRILQERLQGFSDVAHARTLDDRDVRQTLDAAIGVADMISSGELAWVDLNSFNPGPAYETLISQVSSLRTLGPDLARELMRVADTDFMVFKLNLANLKSPVTGPFFAFYDGHLQAKPTEKLIFFIDSLSAFLDEPFMAPMDRYHLTLKVPAGKILMWDDVPLNRAGDLVDAYTQYATQKLEALPVDLRPIFKVIARHTAHLKVASLVAQAQTFRDAPSLYNGYNLKEVTHSQVTNIANVTPLFSKLLGIFKGQGFVDNNARIQDILVDQNYTVLERIEKILEMDNVYGAENEELVTRWSGEEMLGLALFGVHSIAEMKSYLTAQRMNVSFLAKDLAEPILTMMSLGYENNHSRTFPLIDKWLGIIKDLQSYETQSPTNSVKVLEDFLTYQLNEMSLDDGCVVDDMDPFGMGDSDFFLAIRDKYYSMIKSRCELLAGYHSVKRFNEAAVFFNKFLSQRYPFTLEKDSVPDALEAEVEDVQTFFDLYDALTDYDKDLLMRASHTLGAPRTVGDFMAQVDSVRPLLLASLDQGMKKQIPGVKINVAFRTNRDQEIGGNKIIDWRMNFGDHLIDGRDKDHHALWRAGAPIDVTMRWAADADTVPIPDPRDPHLTVSGPQAVFSYRGRWSLIKLLRTHGLVQNCEGPQNKAPQQVLEFFVPTAYSPACYQGQPPRLMERKSEPARLYCQLAMHLDPTAQKNTTGCGNQGKGLKKTMVKPLAKAEKRFPNPRFPVEAPVVSSLDTKALKTPKRLRRP